MHQVGQARVGKVTLRGKLGQNHEILRRFYACRNAGSKSHPAPANCAMDAQIFWQYVIIFICAQGLNVWKRLEGCIILAGMARF